MRAVHVANHHNDRLYYLVDDEDGHDGAILRANSEPIFIQFWAYVTRVSGEKGWDRVTNTKFHDFLWFGHQGDLNARWLRVFMERRSKPNSDLLLSVPVVTDFPKHSNRKKSSRKRANRAIQFKTLTAAGLHEKALGRNIGGARRVVQRLVRGADFNPDAVDADLDQIVQEGTPFERPALLNKPDVPRIDRRIRTRQAAGLKNRREGRGWRWFDRRGKGASREDMRKKGRYLDGSPDEKRQILAETHKLVDDKYSGGKPIRTHREMREALMKAHPGFANGSSKADFAGSGLTDEAADKALGPIEREIGYALLYNIHVNPSLKDVRINAASQRTRKANPQMRQGPSEAGGWALFQSGLRMGVDEDDELAVLKDGRPTVHIGYKGDTPEKNGVHAWDEETDFSYNPRANPEQTYPLDNMATRMFITMMDELNSERLMGDDEGWDEDPTDNWTTPDSRTGVPRSTKRSKKVKKQYEEAVKHAAHGIGQHEFTHAGHYTGMRNLLRKAIREKYDIPEGESPYLGLRKWVREELPGRMTPRQRRRTMRAQVATEIGNDVTRHGTVVRIAIMTAARQRDAGIENDDSSLKDRGIKGLDGLRKYLGQEVLDGDGKVIPLTEELTTFLNALPNVDIFGRPTEPKPLVPGVDRLTNKHLMDTFGVPPIWASMGKTQHTQPMSSRGIVGAPNVDESGNLRGPFDQPEMYFEPHAFDMMLEHGTPAFVVHAGPREEHLIPALSPESTHTLIAAAGRMSAQAEDLHEEIGSIHQAFEVDTDDPPSISQTLQVLRADQALQTFPSKVANIPNDKPGEVGLLTGGDALKFLDPDLPQDQIDAVMPDEMNISLQLMEDEFIGRMRDDGAQLMGQLYEQIGMEAFHFDEMDEAEVDAAIDVVDRSGIEGILDGQAVLWNPYMGAITAANPSPPGLFVGLQAQRYEFFAELLTAQHHGLTIKPSVTEFTKRALEKASKFIKPGEKLRARMNLEES